MRVNRDGIPRAVKGTELVGQAAFAVGDVMESTHELFGEAKEFNVIRNCRVLCLVISSREFDKFPSKRFNSWLSDEVVPLLNAQIAIMKSFISTCALDFLH